MTHTSIAIMAICVLFAACKPRFFNEAQIQSEVSGAPTETEQATMSFFLFHHVDLAHEPELREDALIDKNCAFKEEASAQPAPSFAPLVLKKIRDGKMENLPMRLSEFLSLIYYTGDYGSSYIKRAVWNDPKCKTTFAPLARSAVDGLKRLPAYDKPTYSGMVKTQGELNTMFVEHHDWVTPNFLSTSKLKYNADSFRMPKPGSEGLKSVLLLVNGKTGRSIQALSAFQSTEDEVLFPPNTRFYVKSVEEKNEKNDAGVPDHYTLVTLDDKNTVTKDSSPVQTLGQNFTAKTWSFLQSSDSKSVSMILLGLKDILKKNIEANIFRFRPLTWVDHGVQGFEILDTKEAQSGLICKTLDGAQSKCQLTSLSFTWGAREFAVNPAVSGSVLMLLQKIVYENPNLQKSLQNAGSESLDCLHGNWCFVKAGSL